MSESKRIVGEIIATSESTRGFNEKLILALSNVPRRQLLAAADDFAKRKLSPVIADKIRTKFGSASEVEEAALAIAREHVAAAVRNIRERGFAKGNS